MPSVARLAVSVTANTGNFNKGMDRSRRGLRGFSRNAKQATLATRALSKVLIAAGGALGALALGRGIIRAAKSVNDFNQAMRSSLAIMGDVSVALRRDMTRAAIEVAKTTKFSGEEAAKAFFFLASAGLDARQSIAAMPLVSKFAQAGMFDLAKATDLVTDAQSALGLTVKDAGKNLKNMTRVADVLVKANTLANASVEQFSEALTNKAAAAFKIYGISIEEGVAALAAFADQGKKGADAGTAMDIVLRDLTTRAILASGQMRKYGISVFDSAGRMRKFFDIISDVERALSKQSAETKKLTLLNIGFQQKSVSNLQTLLGTSEAMREYYTELLRAGGITADVSAKQLTPLNAALQELSGSWLELATNMTPALNSLAESVSDTADMLSNLQRIGAEAERIGKAIASATIGGVFGPREKRIEAKLGMSQPLVVKPPDERAIGFRNFLERTIEDLTPDRFRGPVPGPTEFLVGPSPPTLRGTAFGNLFAPLRILRAFGKATFDEWNAKLAEFNKKVASVQGVVQGLLSRAQTPAERFTEQLDALNVSLAAGKINATEFQKALKQARMEMEQRLARLAPSAAALPAAARTAEFQQIALSRVAIRGVNTPGHAQIVRDPQLVDTNETLDSILAAIRVGRFSLTS